MKQPKKIERMYSLNQEKVDEALQEMVNYVLDVASDKKLLEIIAETNIISIL